MEPEMKVDIVKRSSEELAAAKSRIDSGLHCLITIANYHGVAADAAQIKHAYSIATQGATSTDLLRIAKDLGFKSKKARIAQTRLRKLNLPAMLVMQDNSYIIAAKCTDTELIIFDPLIGKPTTVKWEAISEQWTNQVILLAPKLKDDNKQTGFGLKWFIPALWKHKRLIGEVLIASLFIQIFGLISPLVTQVIIDKVLVHQGITTLNVLIIGLLIVIVFEFLMGISKNYVFTHTTSRIDITLGVRLFQHLFRLPLAYFENRRIGETIARIRELENIRQFLTGAPLTAVLDFLFIFVYFIVMFYYSPSLSFLVLGSFPLFILLSALFTPLIRRRLEEKFEKGAEQQSYLVEAVSGIQTIKSFALEPLSQKKWEGLLSGYVKSGFKLSILSGTASSLAQVVQKVFTLAILWYGTHLVLNGDISVGQLIAFQMMAGRVSDPVLRLVQMWQDFQQTGISIKKLNDIFSVQPEPSISATKTRLPQIKGSIEFQSVTFRYRLDGPEVLRRLSFTAEPGQVIGVVGRSGSGKSTLSKLIQRLYVPESGKILVDGIDLSLADPSWLRRQVGVVLQENYLFSGTIRENIAIHSPSSSIQDVARVAQLAGAHEFILELSEGYDTVVGERGATLSGGQKQRIAIARALLANPRILIFDEATSALDYESERIIQQNLQKICQGRTVIMIAHRLSTIRMANKIIVIDKGELAEQGSHDQLMAAGGLYRYLHSHQERV